MTAVLQRHSVMLIRFLLAVFFTLGAYRSSISQVVTYAAPAGASVSGSYSMTVNGTNNPVFYTGTQNAHYAYFDFGGGPVQISVTSLDDGPFNRGVRINPISKGISASVSGNTTTFTIYQPGHYTVERPDLAYRYPGDKVLVISANPIETNAPSPTDPNILYYGPGNYNVGNITLQSNQTLYVAGGAILNATQISAQNVSNVSIRGHGMISISQTKDYAHHVLVSNASHLTMDGVAIFAPDLRPGFIVLLAAVDTATINNIKEFGSRTNHDGINCQPCSNLQVTNSLIRSEDDAFAFYADIFFGSGLVDNKNIILRGNTVWPLLSGVVRIGSNDPVFNVSAQVHGLTLEDTDVLHMQDQNNFPYGFLLDMREQSGSRTFDYEDLLFRNIRLGEADMFVNVHLDNATGGKLRNLRFQDINLYNYPVRTTADDLSNQEGTPGYSYIGINDVDAITFQNVTIAGTPVRWPADAGATLHGDLASTPERISYLSVEGTPYNLLTNSSFENNGAGTLTGWNYGANVFSEAGGYYGGFRMAHYAPFAYSASTAQNLTGVPSGKYSMRLWAQGSGNATLNLTGGGTDSTASLPNTQTWTQVTVPDLSESGALNLNFISSGVSAYSWLRVDDVQLFNQQANLVANYSFEQDPSLSSWASSGNNPSAAFTEPGGHTGVNRLAHYSSQFYNVFSGQTIAGLSNGTYTLQAQVQGSGNGQTMQVNNYGGSTQSVTIPGTQTWTTLTIPNVAVTNGQCTIGFYSNVQGYAWIRVDDVQFYQQ